MNFTQIAFILSWSTPVILLISVFIGVFRIKTLSSLFKLLLLHLIIALLFDLTSRVLGLFIFGSNLIIIPIYALVELSLMSYIYHNLFVRNYKTAIIIMATVGAAFSIYELATIELFDPSKFQSYSRVFVAFLVVIYAMIFFFERLSTGTNPKDYKLAINTGILIYYSLSVVLLLPINFLINDGTLLKYYFLFGYLFLTILFYLFLTYTIWKNGKTLKHLRSGLE